MKKNPFEHKHEQANKFDNGLSATGFLAGFDDAMNLSIPVFEWCSQANNLLDDIDAALPAEDEWVIAIRELTEKFKELNAIINYRK